MKLDDRLPGGDATVDSAPDVELFDSKLPFALVFDLSPAASLIAVLGFDLSTEIVTIVLVTKVR